MLDHLLRIGDRVVHNPHSKSDDPLRRTRLEHGTEATITGFEEAYIGYGEGRTPGVYYDTRYASMLYNDGFTIEDINTSLYHLKSTEEYDRRLLELLDLRAAHPNDWTTIINNQRFVRNLPKTKFWVGDIVTVKNPPTEIPASKIFDKEIERLRKQPVPPSFCTFDTAAEIRKIYYDRLDAAPYHVNCSYKPGIDRLLDLHCRPENRLMFPNGCATFSFAEADLELITRGRLWKYYHQEPIDFSNLEDEVRFAQSVGNLIEINAIPTVSYDDAMAILRAKRAHGIKCLHEANGYFGGEYRLITFQNQDLAERVWHATLHENFVFHG